MTWNVQTILSPVQVSKMLYAICFLNSKSSKQLPSYKSLHFQNKAKWRTYNILMLPKFNFLHECFLQSHALQQRPWISYEWLVSNLATMLIAQLLWNRDVFKWKCFYLILLNTQIQHLSLSEQKSLPNQAWLVHTLLTSSSFHNMKPLGVNCFRSHTQWIAFCMQTIVQL